MLTQITIENLKCIEKANLKLAPLTLITGANSSGKSTALQALMLAIKNGHETNAIRMEKVLGYLEDFDVIRNKNKNARRINISVLDDGGNENSLEINKFDSVSNGLVNYYYETKEREAHHAELLYLNANRIGAEDFVSVSSNQKIGANGEFLFSHFEKIKNTQLPDYLLKPDSQAQDLSYQVAQWLSEITGSELELKTELIADRVRVFFQIEDIQSEVSPFNLGAGVSYLAKVLIICLMAKKGDLVIIENPEIHLHPKSQALLGKFFTFIANAGIQLVIETHCEHLINHVRYQVSEEQIDYEKVAIHYKASNKEDFISLFLNDYGHYVDEMDEHITFPKGFFDASVDALLSIR